MSGLTNQAKPQTPLSWSETRPGHMEAQKLDPARYTRFVGIMRISLPLIAALLLVLLVAWPMMTDQPSADFTIVMEEVGEVSGDLKMVNPHYSGTDAKGRTFSVSAKEAFPDKPDPSEIRLSFLEANIRDEQGQDLLITADNGYYYPKREQLRLVGNIKVHSAEGYTAIGEQAEIDLANGTLTSQSKVAGEGPLGSLEADTMQVNQADKTVKFQGGVKMTINPKNPDTPK